MNQEKTGSSGDGYVWKYLYSISPSDIKFDSTNYIPVPSDWYSSVKNKSERTASTGGQLKIVTVRGRGVGVGTAKHYIYKVPFW